MKKLMVNDEVLEAEKIIKTETDIIGYVDNKEVFAFRGIKDFSIFKLEGGHEFDTPEDDLNKRIKALEQSNAELMNLLAMQSMITPK
ncbi:hypothetical protein OR62_07715 [Clostridium tetani]|uniref:Phage protein n=1 Tax=Clostridium tetani TaxID=1513 RepID=A0ABY0EQS6_CLOTA|nr:hypothetical protein [Clostridium tetani]KHO39114.1 hypothetical protein OR62_07715 [Clostridium tetani]RXI57405.1 hypothetical protein DP131_05235 [Clostridium tetani]RXI66983.1 hypothetical protein DQN76_12620 [Clostridium tetani]